MNVRTRKIMIVDDDASMRGALRVMLEKNGYLVLDADDSATAVACYRDSAPDLVLLDIMLPGDHGLNAMQKLLACDADARIIVFSGMQQKELIKNALARGAREFIAKPFELDEMLTAIHAHSK